MFGGMGRGVISLARHMHTWAVMPEIHGNTITHAVDSLVTCLVGQR